MTAKVYVFDAYGTLFDVHSAVARSREVIGPAADGLSEIWRVKQLEYSWTRTLMRRYVDFWTLTEQALEYAVAATIGSLDPSTRAALLDAYRTLDAYPEVPATLTRLRASGARTAILSNGSEAMLETAVEAAGLAELFDAVLSVHAVGVFKTSPRAYELVGARFGTRPEEVSFQSSNRWDIAGAKAFGFRAVWINRRGAPDEYPDLAPDDVLNDLSGLR